ncbi:MAG: HAD family hydrolase [Pyrinomonadaceae bacterium]
MTENLQVVDSEGLRVILWDIDGTLIRSRGTGSFWVYFKPVLLKLFGTAGNLGKFQVSGMTDLQIIYEALKDEGFTPEQIIARTSELCEMLPPEMRRATATGEVEFYLLPGVIEALEAVAANPRYRSALLTGNIEPAAHVKLDLVGLDQFFALPGAFGDTSLHRQDLPAIAAERINANLGTTVPPDHFIVIGDTPNDIATAKYFGARSIAVATGRSFNPAMLAECGPDVVLNDLSDLDLLMKTLAGF